jgi:hypothetical protein
VGALVLIVGAVALYFWKRSGPPPVTTQSTTATAPKREEPPPPQFAPPPPPPLEEVVDAGTDAGKPAPKSTGGGAPVGGGPCGSPCTGEATGALSSALRAHAQTAQGCYKRALRTGEVSGSMTVSVQVGPAGQVCSASLVRDEVHSGEVSSCVLGRFRGQTFPPPSGGCVVANIPISFSIKQ